MSRTFPGRHALELNRVYLLFQVNVYSAEQMREYLTTQCSYTPESIPTAIGGLLDPIVHGEARYQTCSSIVTDPHSTCSCYYSTEYQPLASKSSSNTLFFNDDHQHNGHESVKSENSSVTASLLALVALRRNPGSTSQVRARKRESSSSSDSEKRRRSNESLIEERRRRTFGISALIVYLSRYFWWVSASSLVIISEIFLFRFFYSPASYTSSQRRGRERQRERERKRNREVLSTISINTSTDMDHVTCRFLVSLYWHLFAMMVRQSRYSITGYEPLFLDSLGKKEVLISTAW